MKGQKKNFYISSPTWNEREKKTIFHLFNEREKNLRNEIDIVSCLVVYSRVQKHGIFRRVIKFIFFKER
jgi:predicted aconitase